MRSHDWRHGIIIIALFVATVFLFALDSASLIIAAPLATPTRATVQSHATPTPAHVGGRPTVRAAASGTFGSVAILNADSNILHVEPAIAVDPNNANRILAASMLFYPPNNPVYVNYYLSTNGGTTWRQGDTTKSNGASGGIDPWVTFDNLGNGYLIQNSISPDGIYMARLWPSNSWSLSYPITLTLPNRFNDKPFVQADRTGGAFSNRIYLTWTGADLLGGTAGIYLRYVDAANFPNWSRQVRVDAPFAVGVQWSYIAVGADGALNVAYLAQNPTLPILLAKSMDGGISFTRTFTIALTNRLYNLGGSDRLIGGPNQYLNVNDGPILVTHPTDPSKLAAVWMDGYNCATPSQCANAHIVASTSVDGGATWSNRVIVNDDGDLGNRDHFFPAMAVGSDATLHVSWYDRRVYLDCANNPYVYNVAYSYSTDWGQTWSPNVRVSASATDPANPNFGAIIYGNPRILAVGDYSGIAVAGDGSAVWPIWIQTRFGAQKVAAAGGVTPVTAPAMPSACVYDLPFIMKSTP